jgi:hypothetical protein
MPRDGVRECLVLHAHDHGSVLAAREHAERDLQVRRVAVGGGDNGAGVRDVAQIERRIACSVARDELDPAAVRHLHQHRIRLQLHHHDVPVERAQVFDDARPHVAAAEHEDVTARTDLPQTLNRGELCAGQRTRCECDEDPDRSDSGEHQQARGDQRDVVG